MTETPSVLARPKPTITPSTRTLFLSSTITLKVAVSPNTFSLLLETERVFISDLMFRSLIITCEPPPAPFLETETDLICSTIVPSAFLDVAIKVKPFFSSAASSLMACGFSFRL